MSTDVEIILYQSDVDVMNSPILSILVPYFHDDPVPLIKALSDQCKENRSVEVLVYDDGSNDKSLNKSVAAAIQKSEVSARLFIASQNHGRSFARNQLTGHAKANWVLFLDADMLPQTNDFVSKYISLIEAGSADVIFGGFKVPSEAHDPDHDLHRALSEISDCLSLEQRNAAGPQFVASSNLAVRKHVLEAEPFDAKFSGWGWEDSEWAARVTKRFKLIHADNPALHLGLETTDTLLRRFQTSGPNYLRFTRKHPDLAKTLPLYNIIQNLRRIPGQKILRPFLKLIIKFRFVPIRLRITALKLWRASWYAETFA